MSVEAENGGRRLSLDTAAARNLATTVKTVPQTQGTGPRWLLRMLPWVQVSGGTYRVNRRLVYARGGGPVLFDRSGDEVRVVPAGLRQVAPLADLADQAALTVLADSFDRREVAAGTTIAERGRPAAELHLIARGTVERTGPGRFDRATDLGALADGDHFGDQILLTADAAWEFTAVAATPCTLLTLPRHRFRALLDRSDALAAQIGRFLAYAQRPQNKRGEADIQLASGHHGEPPVPGTFADYEIAPREYELSVAQTVLRVHTRVSDLYNRPMDQLEQQLRLTIDAIRERQEHDLINNPDFGLLHNVGRGQRVTARSGPPTPDDMDDLLTRRRGTRLFLAHPAAIAALGRERSRRGLPPDSVEAPGGAQVAAWRGVPIFPCDKIPITPARTTTILALRTGAEDEGVVGLHQVGVPDEYEPGLNVRPMTTDGRAITAYLVSTAYSAAALVPDALGALEHAEV